MSSGRGSVTSTAVPKPDSSVVEVTATGVCCCPLTKLNRCRSLRAVPVLGGGAAHGAPRGTHARAHQHEHRGDRAAGARLPVLPPIHRLPTPGTSVTGPLSFRLTTGRGRRHARRRAGAAGG